MTSDTTGASLKIHDAAASFLEKLEALVPGFTLRIIDRWERGKLKREEDDARKVSKKTFEHQIGQDVAAYEAEVTANTAFISEL